MCVCIWIKICGEPNNLLALNDLLTKSRFNRPQLRRWHVRRHRLRLGHRQDLLNEMQPRNGRALQARRQGRHQARQDPPARIQRPNRQHRRRPTHPRIRHPRQRVRQSLPLRVPTRPKTERGRSSGRAEKQSRGRAEDTGHRGLRRGPGAGAEEGRARAGQDARLPEVPARDGDLPAGGEADERLGRDLQLPARAEGTEGAGGALHGLRGAVLPVQRPRLPPREHHPEVEPARLPEPVAACVEPALADQQLPGVHREGVPRAL